MFSFKRVGCVSQRLGSATFDRISAALMTDLTSFWRQLHASNVAGTACCDDSFVILFFREAHFCSIANRRELSQLALSAMMSLDLNKSRSALASSAFVLSSTAWVQ